MAPRRTRRRRGQSRVESPTADRRKRARTSAPAHPEPASSVRTAPPPLNLQAPLRSPSSTYANSSTHAATSSDKSARTHAATADSAPARSPRQRAVSPAHGTRPEPSALPRQGSQPAAPHACHADDATNTSALPASAAPQTHPHARTKRAHANIERQGAISAQEKSKLEDREAKLADEKSELADEKSKLADEKSKLEDREAKLADEKSKLADEKSKLEDREAKLEGQRNQALDNLKNAAERGNAELQAFWMREAEECSRRLSVVQGRAKELEGRAKELEGRAKQLDTQGTELARTRNILYESRRVERAEWEVDFNAAEVMRQLLLYGYDPVKLPHEVEVLKMSVGLTEETKDCPWLIIRPHTRLLCEAAFNFLRASRPTSRVVVTGAPGIGKTRTLMVIALLFAREGSVIYYVDRKLDFILRFDPDGNGGYAAKRTNAAWEQVKGSVGENDVVLVDPAVNGNDVHRCNGKLVVAASSNAERHFFKWDDEPLTKIFKMGHWALEEVLVTRNMYGTEEVSEATARYRYEVVGGAPRYICSEEAFEKRRQRILKVSHSLSACDASMLLSSSPIVEKESKNGTLSTQYVTYEAHPSEGEEKRYMRPIVVCVSRFARAVLVFHFYATCYQEVLAPSDPRSRSLLGAKFEDLTFMLLANGGEYMALKCGNVKRSVQSVPMRHTRLVTSGSDMDKILASIGERSGRGDEWMQEVYACPAGYKMVDFVDSAGNLYNSTIDLQHTVNVARLVEVIRKMHPAATGAKITRGRAKLIRVNFFWCVPNTARYYAFRRRIEQHREALRTDLPHVTVLEHVLFLDPDSMANAKSRQWLGIIVDGNMPVSLRF